MKLENNSEKLGKEKIKKLLLKLSIPGVISLFFTYTYNLVDTIFVGRIGVNAISALSIAFPFQMILIAIAGSTGIGVSAYISKALGKKDREKAINAAGNTITITIIYGLIVGSIGFFFSNQIISLFVNNEEIIFYASSYIKIIFIGSIFLFYQISAAYIFRGQGNLLLPMWIIIGSSILNMVLDPILIFGWFGLPAMGISGAALSTVIARFIGSIFLTILLVSNRNELRLHLKNLYFKLEIVKNIYKVGLPTILLQIQSSISLFIINSILLAVSITAIAAYGIFFKIQMFIFVPIFGMTQAFIPIIGYNYAAGYKNRVKEALKNAVFYAFIITFIAFLFIEIFAEQILSLFTPDSNLIKEGTYIFRIITIFFFLYGPGIIISTFFLSIGKSLKAYLIFTSRDYLFLIPIFFILITRIGLNQAWFAFPAADFFTALTAGLLLFRNLKDL